MAYVRDSMPSSFSKRAVPVPRAPPLLIPVIARSEATKQSHPTKHKLNYKNSITKYHIMSIWNVIMRAQKIVFFELSILPLDKVDYLCIVFRK